MWAPGGAHADVLNLLTALVNQRLVAPNGAFRQLAEVLMARQPVPEAASLALLAALASEGESEAGTSCICRTRHACVHWQCQFSYS